MLVRKATLRIRGPVSALEHLRGPISYFSCSKSGFARAGSLSLHVQARHLHATWSILLNHYWLYKGTPTRSALAQKLTLEETDLPCEGIPTVLFLHDAHADLQQGRQLAEQIIVGCEGPKPTIQCLMVDLR